MSGLDLQKLQAMMTEVRPDWGHALLTPEGREIRVPASAFPRLSRIGVLVHRHGGLPTLRQPVYDLLRREYDTITDGLRQLLGEDLSGPAWLVCLCKECQSRASESDPTLDPVTARAQSGMLADEAIRDARRSRRVLQASARNS